jgi:hypothetical protein
MYLDTIQWAIEFFTGITTLNFNVREKIKQSQILNWRSGETSFVWF